ncbi:NUDIX hydrolase [Streptomyces syringium]|uniref:NUDIX hydrolase n=1 Tax=Streptomyces syringium TaxID=76729 RepID=UPI0033E0AB37
MPGGTGSSPFEPSSDRTAVGAVIAPGYWTPVGGRPEPGESLADTVAREVAEETDSPSR